MFRRDPQVNCNAPMPTPPEITKRRNEQDLDGDFDQWDVSWETAIKQFEQLLSSPCVIPVCHALPCLHIAWRFYHKHVAISLTLASVQSQLALEPHDQCLVSEQPHTLAIAFFAVFAIAVFFEYLRVLARRLDNWIMARALRHSLDRPSSPPEKNTCADPERPDQRCGTGLLTYPDIESGRKGKYVTEIRFQLLRALLYLLITMLGYMLVLFVVMTLNVIVILAVLLGAAVGKFFTDWLKFDIVLSKSETPPAPVATVSGRSQPGGDRADTAGRYT